MMLLRTVDMYKYEASLYVIRLFTLNSKLTSLVKRYNDSRNLCEFAWSFPWFDLKKVTQWNYYVGTEGRERFSSNPFAILKGGEWSAPCSICFILGKDPVPIVQEAGCISQLVWTEWKSAPLPGLDPQTVRPIAQYYTNCTIPAGDTASFCWILVGYLSEMYSCVTNAIVGIYLKMDYNKMLCILYGAFTMFMLAIYQQTGWQVTTFILECLVLNLSWDICQFWLNFSWLSWSS
jgi:hypothetical protein